MLILREESSGRKQLAQALARALASALGRARLRGSRRPLGVQLQPHLVGESIQRKRLLNPTS